MVNEFCEFIITALFLWAISSMSSTMLIFELVKYLTMQENAYNFISFISLCDN